MKQTGFRGVSKLKDNRMAFEEPRGAYHWAVGGRGGGPRTGCCDG